MSKRKKKLSDIEENLDTLKEQEGEPVIGKLEGVEKISYEDTVVGTDDKDLPVIDMDKPAKELKTIKLEKITPAYKIVEMPPTSEIFSIKDQGNSKLVIKKDGTRLTIPK